MNNLYNKYRPKDFDSVIGNESEVESFKNQLSKNKSHVYLLTGPAGCGKTTLARIAANQLGANDMTITEINSSNNRGIDTAREIIDQMTYKPLGGSCRVYIIDEVHGASKDWQEAMLKPLEDTPDHIYFFLCTTDPGKLKETLKSRCTQIKVSGLNEDQLYRLLRRVAKDEGIETSKELIQEIASNSNGSPRTALVLLEKIAEVKDEKTAREIIVMGEEAEREVIELCRGLLNNKGGWDPIAKILLNLKDTDPEKCRLAVLGYMNSVLLKSGSRQAGVVIECFGQPFWNNGKAGLTLACYQSVMG